MPRWSCRPRRCGVWTLGGGSEVGRLRPARTGRRRPARSVATTVERQSHDRPDAHDHAQWLAAIEQAIEEGWPQVFADSLPDWVRDEEALLHTPDQHHPDCSICVPRGWTCSARSSPPVLLRSRRVVSG
jgi:hypothetical protein